ncbi:hypothetical protein SSX86_004882 [Deinandra increscens subsp. villosa]|uniref:Uncharacterized protein n=1 Tax=Deinandra increscens subsp. villosa TaxID=3103831 RepID=A0AAP0DNZ1_9ASTR
MSVVPRSRKRGRQSLGAASPSVQPAPSASHTGGQSSSIPSCESACSMQRGPSSLTTAAQSAVRSRLRVRNQMPCVLPACELGGPVDAGPSSLITPAQSAGAGIQALFDDSHERDLDNLIKLMSCYRIEGYKCTRAPSLMRVARHAAAISMDSSTPITPIADTNDIPRFYFNFTAKKDLDKSVNRNDTLTDFIGKVDRVTATQTESRGVLTKIMLQESSRVDVEALNATDHHVIAAITGLRVTKPLGQLQLQSTGATVVHIDPNIEMARSVASRYCITATLSDNTGSLTATLFGNAVASLVGLSCYDMIKEHGHTDDSKMPDILHSVKGIVDTNY